MKIFVVYFCLFCSFIYAKNINIGVVMPLTGPFAAYGQSALDGIKIANKMKNKLDNNDTINLVVVDTKGDKIESLNSSTRLVLQDGVLGIIGEMVTTNTLQVMRVGEERKIPVIAPAATGDKLISNKKYSSRVCFMDSFQGSSLAKYVYNNLFYKTAVIITDNSTDYSVGLSKAFDKEFKALGGNILAKIKITSGDKDYKAIVAQIKKLNPEFIYLPIYYTEASLFTRQARNAGLNVAMGSADGVADKTFISLSKDASNGYIFTDSFDYTNPPTKLSKEFISMYEKEKRTQDIPNFSAMGADAYFVMVDAMNRCLNNLTSECINEKIHDTKYFNGVSGIINIDKSGNATRSLVIKEIKDQKQVFKYLINP